MGFLSGSMTFECFRVHRPKPRRFGQEHIEILQQYAIGNRTRSSLDVAQIGFLAGDHLFDQEFRLEKNVIGDAMHFAVRIDTNQVPAAVRRAWLQMELAAATAESDGGRPTKAQRQQAKDAVEARCEEAMGSEQFLKMQQFPVLWDGRDRLLYFGGSSAAASDACCDLLFKAFQLETQRLSSGNLGLEWAAEAGQAGPFNHLSPAAFRADGMRPEVAWWGGESENFDFLGNEFLLWLWWRWEADSDTLELADGSFVTGMFARTMSLECPRGESGKGTIAAEDPTQLPEAAYAVHSGKLPRKAGLILVRQGEQYELTLQAESFLVSSAKIVADETAEGQDAVEDRIESIRGLRETLDLLYGAFCKRRAARSWSGELKKMQEWLKAGKK